MTPEAQRTRAALADLVEVLAATQAEVSALQERSRDLTETFVGGRALRDVLPQEPRPLIVARITEVLDRLGDAGAAFRRAEAAQLRAEGLTQQQIADLFGVTRQRVAALLEPAPPPEARAARRPRRSA